MRWMLLLLASVPAALGLLTVFKAPAGVNWKLALVASDFGYAIAAVPLAAALLSWFLPGGRGGLAIATCILGVLGFALLIQPCVQALLIGRDLPRKLERQFGPAEMGVQPFTFTGLFRKWPARAPRSTWTYSGSQELDFYPAIGRAPAPGVIVIHGGGWDDGARGQIPHLNDWLARCGYAVADVSYRLAPGAVWPAQRDDIAAAISFVKARSASWGVDPARLVILGRSAGGQIAQACAYAFRDPSVRGVVALYSPADMHFAWAWGREDDPLDSPRLLRQFLGGTPETARAAYDSSSGFLLADSGSPPTLLVHGTIDTLVWHRQSERLAARLSDAGAPNLLVSLPWATHALEYNLSSPSGQLTTYALGWFLAAVCRQ
jgi:acetyl esterase/lipase